MKRLLILVVVVIVATVCMWSWLSAPRGQRLAEAVAFDLGPNAGHALVRQANGDVIGEDFADGLWISTVHAGADAGLLFSKAGDRFVFERDGSLTSVADMKSLVQVPVPPSAGVRMVLNGTARNGVLPDAGALCIATAADASIIALARIDLERKCADALVLPTSFATISLVSASPDGQRIVVAGTPRENPKRGTRMALLDANGAELANFAAAAVAPVWLPDVGAILFQSESGGIWRFFPPEGKPEFVVNGELASNCARTEVARRDLSDPFVLLEKRDPDGFLQVVRVQPFEPGEHREVAVSSGKVDHFGLTVSEDHRFFAYRLATIPQTNDGTAPIEERIVVVDQQSSYRATTVATRTVPPAARDIGPVFSRRNAQGGQALWFITDGWLTSVDFD